MDLGKLEMFVHLIFGYLVILETASVHNKTNELYNITFVLKDFR